ncbi:MAG: RecX family transcriptional regulator [Patescibacteria group bacterium]|nr:RecX family transcriptional regulator [Patescibacteria group bacterium]
MNEKEALEKLFQKSLFFLKFRLRTEKEIRDYLSQKVRKYKLSSIIIEQIIKKLKEEELINDEKFIEIFIEEKIQLKPKSILFLKRELLKHGVANKLIERYFSQNPLNDEELAYKSLAGRWQRWKKISWEKRYKKAVSFLLRRGFSFETVKKTIEKFKQEE